MEVCSQPSDDRESWTVSAHESLRLPFSSQGDKITRGSLGRRRSRNTRRFQPPEIPHDEFEVPNDEDVRYCVASSSSSCLAAQDLCGSRSSSSLVRRSIPRLASAGRQHHFDPAVDNCGNPLVPELADQHVPGDEFEDLATRHDRRKQVTGSICMPVVYKSVENARDDVVRLEQIGDRIFVSDLKVGGIALRVGIRVGHELVKIKEGRRQSFTPDGPECLSKLILAAQSEDSDLQPNRRIALLFMGFIGSFPAEVRVSVPSVTDMRRGPSNVGMLLGMSTFNFFDEVDFRPRNASIFLRADANEQKPEPEDEIPTGDAPCDGIGSLAANAQGIIELGRLSARDVLDQIRKDLVHNGILKPPTPTAPDANQNYFDCSSGNAEVCQDVRSEICSSQVAQQSEAESAALALSLETTKAEAASTLSRSHDRALERERHISEADSLLPQDTDSGDQISQPENKLYESLCQVGVGTSSEEATNDREKDTILADIERSLRRSRK